MLYDGNYSSPEHFGDDLMEGVDLVTHSADGFADTGTLRMAWLIIVLALAFLWGLGAGVFRNHRQ